MKENDIKETSPEISDENENSSDKKEKRSKANIITYIGCAVVIVLCLVLLGYNLLVKDDKSENSSQTTTTVTTTSVNSAQASASKINDVYTISPLPDGYQLDSQDISDKKVVSVFKNGDTYVQLTQSTISSYECEFDRNDESITPAWYVNGLGQEYNQYHINDIEYIIWDADGYTFEIKSNLDAKNTRSFIFYVIKASEQNSGAQ